MSEQQDDCQYSTMHVEGVDVRTTGQLSLRAYREGFLGTGMTFEDFQKAGM